MKILYGLILPALCVDYRWGIDIQSCEDLWPDGNCQNHTNLEPETECNSADFIKLSITDIESDQTENICLVRFS